MKHIVYLAALLLLPFAMLAQETETVPSAPANYTEQLITPEGDDTSVTRVTRDTLPLVTSGADESPKGGASSDDTIKVRIGDKNIEIIEHEDKTSVDIYDRGEDEEDLACPDGDEKKFRGHWAGFEIGMNNLLDNSGSISRTPEAAFMELKASRSLNVNLNFAQYSLGFGQDRFGLTTGLGIEFSNYFFSNNNTLGKSNGSVIGVDTLGILEKSKLTTTYLRIPLILELQLFAKKRSDRVYISAGIVGGMKLGSHTKTVINRDDGEKKSKDRDDFYLNPFRWGLTTHVGYKGITLYADYYPTSLFQKNKGPELYPFSAGLALTF